MQDAIERKIEKFSSNNVQKRVNTSGKFRNNNNMMLGNLNASQISAQHGPGTSGGQGTTSSSTQNGLNQIKQKKYTMNTNGALIPNELQLDEAQTDKNYYHGQKEGLIKNQQVKRPNTIANNKATVPINQGKSSGPDKNFDINGVKINRDQQPEKTNTLFLHNGSFSGPDSNDRPNPNEVYEIIDK